MPIGRRASAHLRIVSQHLFLYKAAADASAYLHVAAQQVYAGDGHLVVAIWGSLCSIIARLLRG